ncbi:phenol hydroxylase [Natronorubrum tibetense GA33]|uniref:Phenol hydroxylase n=1 Tax=Natronorubrum tibetense GA33 TaxID=1114856 RepID=L9VQX6_9EURY|nr:phenol hydroxylase [Natronorubrum tibetense GA33]
MSVDVRRREVELEPVTGTEQPDPIARPFDIDIDEVHRRRADEAADESVDRVLVDVRRRTGLLEDTVVEDDHPIAHRHRLLLIVRDVDGGDPEFVLNALDLRAHLRPEARVEVGKRLVEEEEIRLANDRPPERDALFLPARKLVGFVLEQVSDPHHFGCLDDAAFAFALIEIGTHPKSELHVLEDGFVGVERVVLEYHRDIPVFRVDVRDVLVADRDRSSGGLLEAGQHSERRRLSATGRTDDGNELAVFDIEIQIVDGDDRAAVVCLAERVDANTCHTGTVWRPSTKPFLNNLNLWCTISSTLERTMSVRYSHSVKETYIGDELSGQHTTIVREYWQ